MDNKVLFLEDHYFRLMASMRICRMEIPMNFTMEYFESQIVTLISSLEKIIHIVFVSPYIENQKDFICQSQEMCSLSLQPRL